MKILVINGPNLNMLGIREPEHYGKETYLDLENKIKNYCLEKCEVELKQSNHEHETAQSDAAVVRPLTENPSRRIVPAPRKPIPLIT